MKQQYDKYTSEDHQVWSIMYGRQAEALKGRATDRFLKGIEEAGFKPDRIPRFTEVNAKLAELTGWQIYEVPGIVADDLFFKLLAEKKFPATTWIRKMSELEYIEEPDMFHDVFGHIPLLVDEHYCGFLQGLSRIALKHIDDPWAIELMSRLYWFTIEFGLIEEDDKLKIYGAGLLSSVGETMYSLNSDVPERRDYDIATIFNTPYIKEKFQVVYYIIHSYEQLYNSVDDIEQELEHFLQQEPDAAWLAARK